jgi:hypothetical protein
MPKYALYHTDSIALLFVSVQLKHRNSLFWYRTETNILFRIVPKLVLKDTLITADITHFLLHSRQHTLLVHHGKHHKLLLHQSIHHALLKITADVIHFSCIKPDLIHSLTSNQTSLLLLHQTRHHPFSCSKPDIITSLASN